MGRGHGPTASEEGMRAVNDALSSPGGWPGTESKIVL